MRGSLVAGTLLIGLFTAPASAAVVGGFNLVSSADSLISSSGTFTTSGGTLSQVLTDSDPGTYAFSFSPGASVTLGFTSGISNGTGNDFVLFELGTPDTFTVTINGQTRSAISAATGDSAGGFSLNAAAFDLSSFGLASGATISSLLIGLDTPNSANGTVPSLSLAGVLNQGSVVPPVPLPGALPLFATGLGALGLLGWRRKKKLAA